MTFYLLPEAEKADRAAQAAIQAADAAAATVGADELRRAARLDAAQHKNAGDKH